MVLPTPFLTFPAKRPTLTDAIGAWLDQTYGRRDNLPRQEVVDGLLDELPGWYFPKDIRALHRAWLVKRLSDTISRNLGMAYTDGQGGSRWDVQLSLPLDDFLNLQIGKLRQANRDVERCRRDVEEYSIANGLGLDVATTLEHLKRAAGF